MLQLICIMYAGFKRIEPGMDIGVELGEEWGMAERLGGEEGMSYHLPNWWLSSFLLGIP